jgi:hypothetical protein
MNHLTFPVRFRMLILLISSIPIGMFAYLGQFSRFMSDDYCSTYIGNEYGIIGGMLYWYQNWSGGYTNFFFKSAWAKLDVAGASLLPVVIICCWTIGAFYLTYQILRLLRISKYIFFWSALFALTFVYVSINALYSPQSFYWLAASPSNTLPIGFLMFYVGFCLHAHREGNRLKYRFLWVVGSVVVTFIIGGFSYVYVSVQAYMFMMLIIGIGIFSHNLLKSILTLLLASGFLGSVLSLAVQLSSPGISVRLAAEAENLGRANLSTTELILRLFDTMTKITASDTVLSGFVILFLLSVLVTVLSNSPTNHTTHIKSSRIKVFGKLFWIGIHLLFIPILWNHSSNSTVILDRFSTSYFLVIVVNLLFVIGSSLAFYSSQLKRIVVPKHWKIIILVLLISIFITKQLFSIDIVASSYLTISWCGLLFSLLFMDSQEELSINPVYIITSTGVVLLLSVAISASVLFGRGLVPLRTLTFASSSFVLLGVIWGVSFGKMLVDQRLGKNLNRYATFIVLALFLLISQIVYHHGSQIPDFMNYARSWDIRNEDITSQKLAGETTIYVNTLVVDLADIIKIVNLSQDPANRCAKQYYGITDLIVSSPGN